MHVDDKMWRAVFAFLYSEDEKRCAKSIAANQLAPTVGLPADKVEVVAEVGRGARCSEGQTLNSNPKP